MKLILSIIFSLILTANAIATLTPGNVPVTKTGGSSPTLQNSDIADSSGAVAITSNTTTVGQSTTSLDTLTVNSGPTGGATINATGTNSATGGTVTTNGSFTVNTFTSSGTFTPNFSGTITVLVVGGGGGADGSSNGGGGGGGGVLTACASGCSQTSYSVTANTPITVSIGAGGLGSNSETNTSGGNSVFGTMTAIGGGYGGSRGERKGANGGSGGGGGGDNSGTTNQGGTGTSGQGNNGGTGGQTTGNVDGGGGGGATASGSNQNGGAGYTSSISGSSVCYAGGGGGSNNQAQGAAGTATCGGGAGAWNGIANGSSGTANTGGGGGASGGGETGGNGGSGIVIVSYKTTNDTPTLTLSAAGTTLSQVETNSLSGTESFINNSITSLQFDNSGNPYFPVLTSNGLLQTTGGSGKISNGNLSGDVTTSGSLATTLATVNSNVGTYQGITVNGKGLVTAASNQSYLTGNQTITLSGDTTGSGTTAITTSTVKVNGLAIPTSKTIVGTNSSGQFIDASSSALTNNTSGTASNLSGTPALPNGTTATTQSIGDNTTKLATTAYVNAGITGSSAVTIAAGGSNQNVTLTPSGNGYTVLNGNVGIGGVTPDTTLGVNGQIRIQGNVADRGIFFADYTGTYTTTNVSGMRINSGLHINAGTTNTEGIYFDILGSNIMSIAGGGINVSGDGYFSGSLTTANNTLDDGSGNLTAVKLIKSGGTSSQFLKADGSVDSSTYLTSLTPWTSNITAAGHSLTNAGGLITYDNANSQNSVVIGNHSWTGDDYSGHPITIGQYRYTSDPNAPYGIQNNWMYGQQDGIPYFFYADAPGGGTLYFGDLYNNYGGAVMQLSQGNIATTSPAGFNMNISGSSSFQITTSANYNSFNIDGTTGAINSTNTAIDNDGQGTFIVNNNENYLTNAFSVMDAVGFKALQVNNSDSIGQGDYVQTLNNVLDDGSGNASFAGTVSFGINGAYPSTNIDANGNINIPDGVDAHFLMQDDNGNNIIFMDSTGLLIGCTGSQGDNGNANTVFSPDGSAIFANNQAYITTDGYIVGNNSTYGDAWFMSGPVAFGGHGDTDIYLATGTGAGIIYLGQEGDAIVVKNNIVSPVFETPSGTSSQFLKADGSVDSSTYLPYKTKGTITLVSGTKALTISGVTTSNQAFVQLVTPGGTLGGAYKAVCTSNTLTVTSIGATGTTITTDTSTLNYLIV